MINIRFIFKDLPTYIYPYKAHKQGNLKLKDLIRNPQVCKQTKLIWQYLDTLVRVSLSINEINKCME